MKEDQEYDWVEVKDPDIISKFGSNKKDSSLLDKISEYAGKFNKAVEASRLPSVAGGFLQGAGDMAASLANIPLGIMGKEKLPHPDLGKYLPQDALSKGAFIGGEIGSGIPAWIGLQGKISKLLPEAKGMMRIGKESLGGAATGALLGENSDGDGRGINSLLGSVAIPATGLRSGAISKNIADYSKNISKEYTKKYNDIFSRAALEGIDNIKLPSVNYELLQSTMPSKQFRSIRNLQNNPTVENAHWAQSDLGKFISKNKNKPNDSETNKAIKEAINAQKKLRGKIYMKFNEKPESRLGESYAATTKGYSEEVVPYKYNKNINEYIAGGMKPSSLVGKLSKNENFLLKQGSKFPELKLQAMLRGPLGKYLIGGAAAGIGMPTAYHYISSYE